MQKKKRKREKAQDSGGEGSNHFPNQRKGDPIKMERKSQRSDIKEKIPTWNFFDLDAIRGGMVEKVSAVSQHGKRLLFLASPFFDLFHSVGR